MEEYYKISNRHLTWRECLKIGKMPGALILWTTKLFGIPLPLGQGLCPEIEFVASLDQLAPAVGKALQEPIEQLQELGFHSPVFYSQPKSLLPVTGGGAALISPDGKSFGVMMHTVSRSL